MQEWLAYQKKKWAWQKNQRNFIHEGIQTKRSKGANSMTTANRRDLSGFFRRTQRTLLDSPWEILQVRYTARNSDCTLEFLSIGVFRSAIPVNPVY